MSEIPNKNIPIFSFSYKPSEKDEKQLTYEVVKTLRKIGDDKKADKLEEYYNHRQHYLDTHYNKYVFITDDSIIKIDNIESLELIKCKKGGVYFKVGNESDNKIDCYYVNISQNINYCHKIPIQFHYQLNYTYTDDAIIDTGCSQTTMNIKVLQWIKHFVGNNYSTDIVECNRVGGISRFLRGKINITFCGRIYESIDVIFADITHVALIGMD